MPQPVPTFRGVAVDVGNSAIHLGWFDSPNTALRPLDVAYLHNAAVDFSALAEWVNSTVPDQAPWHVASVNDAACDKLVRWLAEHRSQSPVYRVTHKDCPIPVGVEHPGKVGMDRLMATVAARSVCDNDPAIVIDAGTAVTVDLLAEGTFQGGAILPGMRMAAAALDRYTDKLPLIDTTGMPSPAAVGKDTADAMKSGMYWGTVGAVRELVHRIAQTLSTRPKVFVTGGDGATLAPHLENAEHVPHMVLSGIAITAAGAERRDA